MRIGCCYARRPPSTPPAAPTRKLEVLILPYAGYRDLYRSYRLDELRTDRTTPRLAGRMPAVCNAPARGRRGGRATRSWSAPGPPSRSRSVLLQIRIPGDLVVRLDDRGIPDEPRGQAVDPRHDHSDHGVTDKVAPWDLRRQACRPALRHPETRTSRGRGRGLATRR